MLRNRLIPAFLHLFNKIGVFFALFFLVILKIGATTPFSLTPEEQVFKGSLKEIKLCVGPGLMPLDDIQGGKHVGLNSEFMTLFEEIIDVPINLVPTSDWSESIENVRTGRCDIISLATTTPQREEFMTFTSNYVVIPFVVVTTQEKFFVSNISDLVDKQLGIRRGYAYAELLRIRFPNIDLTELDSIEEGLEKVNSGELFGYLTGLQIAGYSIQTRGYSNLKINGQFDEFHTIALGIGVNKDKNKLVNLFNKAIDSIEPSEIKRINNSWLTVKYQIVENYQKLIQFSVVVFGILLFLFYRQHNLRKHNRQMAEREKEIWHQANFDFLTSLPNRRLFQDRLEQKISLIERKGAPFALLLIDLDGFKEVNDTLGHNQGDELLIEAAARISSCLRKSDTIARLGGDEFVVILNDISEEQSVEIVTQHILDVIKKPFELKEVAFVSASIGITFCPKDSSDMVELMKNADQAMYAAKGSGRNIFHYFTNEMQQQAQTRMELIRDLRLAIENSEFEVFYQPIVTLSTNRIQKCEALIRWRHPTKGLINPFVFIPVLEETRMIIEVGEWIFIESAKQAKIWRERFDLHFQISVNTSPIQFQNKSTKKWPTLLDDLSVATSAIGIEMTESMLMEGHNQIKGHLTNLRESGFEISLDDFGTGYSSLSYLKKFDIDYLKIDKSFVDNLTEGSNDMVLCEAIIVMAHKLNIKVIAEGVETVVQQKLLNDAGCDYGQGYLFSKPVPAIDFEKTILIEYEKQKSVS